TPGASYRPVVKPTENVHESELVEDPRRPGAFLGQDAGILLVALPALEVDLLVRDVPVAADDHLEPALAQLLQVDEEALQEAVLRLLALRRARSRRQLERIHLEVRRALRDVAH